MARYNSVNTTSSVAGGTTISAPYSGLLTTLTGSGTVTVPNPVLYTGSTQTYYNSTVSAISLITPSGVITGPGLGVGSPSLSLPANSIVTLVSDGTNYLTQAWLGGNISATTLSASAAVNLSPASAAVTINPGTASNMDNMIIGATTPKAGAFTNVSTTIDSQFGGNLGIGISPSFAIDAYGASTGIIRVRGGGANNQGGAFFVNKSDSSATLAAFGDFARIGGGTPDQSVAVYTGTSIPLLFYVSGSEKMRLSASGYVGIGNQSPAVPLDINTTSTTTGIRMAFAGGQSLIMAAGSGGTGLWQVGTGPLQLGVNSNGSYTNPSGVQLTITNTGNVGIGYTADQTANGYVNKFSVNGNAYVSGITYTKLGNQGYRLPQLSQLWVKFGTLNTQQQGYWFSLKLYADTGWNATTTQNQITELHFKTSNTSSNNANFYGDAYAINMLPSGTTSAPSQFIIKQTPDYNTFEIWGYFLFSSYGCHFEYITTPGDYFAVDASTTSSSAPTGTTIQVTPQLNIVADTNNLITTPGNLQTASSSKVSSRGQRVQMGTFSANTTSGDSNTYWHFKTSIKYNRDVTMQAVHAEGFAYGNATLIDCRWGWHTDGNSIYNRCYLTNGSGPSASSIYAASDQYVVVVLYVPSTYFSSVTFSYIQSEMYGETQFSITAWTRTASSSGAY
jgi:hypothetical protein